MNQIAGLELNSAKLKFINRETIIPGYKCQEGKFHLREQNRNRVE